MPDAKPPAPIPAGRGVADAEMERTRRIVETAGRRLARVGRILRAWVDSIMEYLSGAGHGMKW